MNVIQDEEEKWKKNHEKKIVLISWVAVCYNTWTITANQLFYHHRIKKKN